MIPTPITPGSLIMVISSGKKSCYADKDFTTVMRPLPKEAIFTVVAATNDGELFVIGTHGPCWVDPIGSIVLQLVNPDAT